MENRINIEEVWNVELEIMDIIDSICKSNKLKYSIFYGTLLGAVRHKGFIPWDDDIDIMMPRADYEKFIKIWKNSDYPGYLLQLKNTDPEYQCNFAKIRKDNTAYVMDGVELTLNYHKGIFVDIFPADRCATGFISKRMQFMAAAINMLFSREYTSGSGGILEAGEKLLLKLPRRIRPFLRDKSEWFLKLWNSHIESSYCSFNTISDSRCYFPSDMFEQLDEMEFSGHRYLGVHNTDQVLRSYFGNYWELPPEEDRVLKHCPVFVSLTENYKE